MYGIFSSMARLFRILACLPNKLVLTVALCPCFISLQAIEVVDLDQQTKMVAELEGNIMRCVRDQNGNHVIQKCIECIPQDAIQFIVSSFYDQVVTLSTHPYGCRVIQVREFILKNAIFIPPFLLSSKVWLRECSSPFL